ncbi:MAG: hypothetical protein B6242_12840 [Anaerolineaceae bacterium 4572_78]|nr:MAG: hypothetical protein B6242_12840 [Anaerolineaceae bacterium 4572_78]
MNKHNVLQFNVIPEGKKAWLNYKHYMELKVIFEAVDIPTSEIDITNNQYFQLYHFLTNIAKLVVPMNKVAIHFNAFALIRRGYKIEEITVEEYQKILTLMDGLETVNIDDTVLHDFGGHRNLYNHLTRNMGLFVKQGRGYVWHRAKDLVENHEKTYVSKQQNNTKC